MKRIIWLAACAATALVGCAQKGDKKSDASPPAAWVAAPSSGATLTRTARALEAESRDAAAGLAYAADEDAAARAARLFDGSGLRAGLQNAGFAGTDGAPPVLASYRPGTRAALASTRSRTAGAARGLDAAVVPEPPAGFVPGGGDPAARGAGTVLAAFDAFQRAAYADAYPIVSRLGWSAARRRGRAVAMTPTRVTIHHTDGPQTMLEADTERAVKGVQYYHMRGRAAEGKDVWEDIGYHFLVDGAGRVAEGRPAETLGAHVAGGNEGNIGVAVMGDFDRIRPTPAQIDSLSRLVAFLALKYREDPAKDGFLEPHRHYNETDCPGRNMMAVFEDLRRRVEAEKVALQAELRTAPQGRFVPVVTTDA